LDDVFILQIYSVVTFLHVCMLVASIVTEFCWYLGIVNPFVINRPVPPEGV
jgi:hypothetical protein